MNFVRPLYVTILLISLNAALSAQNPSIEFNKIDAFAVTVPDTFNNHYTLAKHLTENYSDDLSKVRSIYFWIINNIDYDEDIASKKKTYFFEHDPDFFFVAKKATCIGYSSLFFQMCQSAGIKCFPISGYIKGIYTIENVYINTVHVWNVVQVNDNWYHLDATFDTYDHQQGIDSLAFLMSFEELSKNRLPSNPLWQFRAVPMSFNEFDPDSKQYPYPKTYNWNWEDTLAHYLQLPELDRIIFEEREIYVFNTYSSIDLGIALLEKGDSIEHADIDFVEEIFINYQAARQYYYEALKYLNPNVPIYFGDDEFGFYREKRAKEYKKDAEYKIKLIEKRDRVNPAYFD